MLVHPNARLTRVVTASAGETIRDREGSSCKRARPSMLSAGTRALLIDQAGEHVGHLVEIEPLDGPHEGERLLLHAENLDV
jgi:hypothetical protein